MGAVGPTLGRRRWRPGLRARVTTTFALGGLLLSVVMAGITDLTARQYFLHQRTVAVMRQAYVNASLLQTALRSSGTQVPQLLDEIDTLPGSLSVLDDRGQWFATSISVGRSALPAPLRTDVLAGTPATQIFDLAGTPELAVGVPVPSVHADYFEVFDLGDLDRTLSALGLTLVAAAVVTAVLGAILGRWVSGRSLRPLAEVSEVAAAIAGGQLGTRLEAANDADLASLATSFNRMADRLQARIEREARFTSDVSHELRSPLTTLSASVEVLGTHRDQLSPRARQALSLLDADLRRFRRMVDDLLEISRFDAGSAELSLDDVEAGELVRRTVAAVSGADVGKAPIPIEMAPGAEDLRLRVDKRRFERMLANLVENASAYAGGVTRITVDKGGIGTVRIAVEDHGGGIPAPERERLFERFYRGPAAGRRGTGDGTGLGLSLVAEHAHLHGGSVRIEDAPGGGARFVLELPVDGGPGGGTRRPGGGGRPGGGAERRAAEPDTAVGP